MVIAPPTTSATVLDGKKIAAELRAEAKASAAALLAEGGRPPKLTALLVGDDPASQTYVASKARACRRAGILSETLHLPADLGTEALLAGIDGLNDDPDVDGILVQLPLPADVDERRVLAAVDPTKDVDGFHPVNVGRLWLGEDALAPATPSGVIELLRRYGVPLSGRHAVIVGRSSIVGKPMAALLLREHCTVTVCHSRTADLAEVCRRADLLIAAVGRPGLIGPDHVTEGTVVVDVGINRVTDRAVVEELFPAGGAEAESRREAFERRGYVLVGDVDFHRVAPKAAAITPVPGGVGPLTVAHLLVNTVRASRRRQERLG